MTTTEPPASLPPQPEDKMPQHCETTEAPPPPRPQHSMLRFFGYEHLPARLRAVSQPCGELAAQMDSQLPDCAEKTAGLRKLLEAKDCFVRALLFE